MLRARLAFHCRRMRGPLLALHEGCLHSRQQRQVADHVERCPECRRFLARLAETDTLLREARPQHVGPLAEPSRELFYHALRASRRRRSPFFRTASAWGLAGVLALVGANAASNRSAWNGSPSSKGGAATPAAGSISPLLFADQLQGPDDGMPPRVEEASMPKRAAQSWRSAVARTAKRHAAPAAEDAGSDAYILCSGPTQVLEYADAEPTSHSGSPTGDPLPGGGLSAATLALGTLIVQVSQPPSELAVEVHDAPAGLPGYARATALTCDASGAPVLAQYTVDSRTPGSELVVTPASPVEVAQAAPVTAIACAPGPGTSSASSIDSDPPTDNDPPTGDD